MRSDGERDDEDSRNTHGHRESGYVRLTTPSKNAREIFSLFGLEEPVAGKITLS